ncbi:MAG: GGDEF domain-containing protein [Pseudomonadota bacterium]|nr:GGDEF domain-containing protein [Pseudomonadota bacterium]
MPNRRDWQQQLNNAIDNARQTERPLSLLFFDIDHFKHINDSLGHAKGDHYLRLLAECIRQNIRNGDIPGRFGGEEFVLLLPDTECQQAANVAERIRQTYQQRAAAAGSTVSIGIACWHRHEEAQNLLGRADQAMYQAKRDGRNCIRTSPAELQVASAHADGRQHDGR